jgi:hypothetical protein
MKVKARTLDFSVPSVGHVKILRNRRKWGILLLKNWYVDTVYVLANEMIYFFASHCSFMYQEGHPTPMFSQPSYEQNDQRGSKLP